MLAERVKEWAEEWKRQGLEAGFSEGLAKGQVKGLAEGKADSLIKLVHIKYGVLPEWALTQIEHADIAQLDAWLEKLLTTDALDDLIDRT